MRMPKIILRSLILISFIMPLFTYTALADPVITPITVEINQSYCLKAGGYISKIAIANPDIADVVTTSSTELLVVAKKTGATSLWIWTTNGMRQQFTVNVTAGNSAIEAAIKAVLPDCDIKVQNSEDNVLLQGYVYNQYQKDTAEKIAGVYGKKVINLLQMSQPYQVSIEAQVIEISKSKEKNLGLLFSNAADIDTTNGIITLGTSGVFGVGQSFNKSYADINATVNALQQNGDAKILSRPNLITLSGKKASILIGGKIPVPVSNNNGEISISWQDYGIKLNIEPTVDAMQNITTKVQAEVSTLDYTNELQSNGFTIPALRTREASTEVTIPSGATMAIGGLMNSEQSKTITKIPILGDLPIIGQFFRNTSKSSDNRELIILVTPRLVKYNTPVKMTDNMEKLYEQMKKDERKDIDVNKKDEVKEDVKKEEPVMTEEEKQIAVSTNNLYQQIQRDSYKSEIAAGSK